MVELIIIGLLYWAYTAWVDYQYMNSPRRDISMSKLAMYEGSKTQLKKDIMAGKLDKDAQWRI